MNKYLIVIETDSPLLRMIRLVGRMEKIINDGGRVVRSISVEQLDIGED